MIGPWDMTTGASDRPFLQLTGYAGVAGRIGDLGFLVPVSHQLVCGTVGQSESHGPHPVSDSVFSTPGPAGPIVG